MYFQVISNATDLIKSDLCSLLCHIDVLVERSVGTVFLLFYCSAELEQGFWDRLVRSSKDIDEPN